jgi:hypothetical protein
MAAEHVSVWYMVMVTRYMMMIVLFAAAREFL